MKRSPPKGLTRFRIMACRQTFVGKGIGMLLGVSCQVGAESPEPAIDELLNLSLAQLSNLKVTSASKKPEKLSETAASIYVISADDIRRSGAITLPEILRLAPNLQVARVDADRYAVSARGFNSTTANKLQVLIDGRVAYTPLYSGVFWDVQNVLPEDIERIEIISGANATVWGSNAVNGVINIITRSSADTRNKLLTAGAGNLERDLSFRHGGELGNGHYRIYGKTFQIDESELETGGDAGDKWHNSQVGFRIDTDLSGDFTLQGDAYYGRQHQALADTGEIKGLNLMARWQHELGDNQQLELQAYYDRTERELPGTFAETLDIVDIELQHRLQLAASHDILWGVNYRSAWDDVDNSRRLAFFPADKQLRWSSFFIQDAISLTESVQLTIGGRLEYNSYTNMEFMPNIRLGWNITPEHLVWTSLARSVRTPSRLDREFFVPGTPPFLLQGGPDFKSEIVNSIDVGYRGSLTSQFSFSATAFYHDYDDLRTLEPEGASFVIDNGLEAESYGLETWADWQVSNNWLLKAGGLWMHEDMDLKPDSNDVNNGQAEANDPSSQWQLRSSHQLSPQHELEFTLRHVGELDNLDVPDYTTLDIRFGWHITSATEVSVKGSNLLDPEHPEFGTLPGRSEVNRSVYLKLVHWF